MTLRITIAFGFASLLAVSPAQADIVTDWAEVGWTLDQADDVWAEERYFAQTKLALAMFEAANAVDRQYASYLGVDAATPGASIDAAVMTAAHEVLVAHYPGRKAELDGSYELALAGIANGEARDAGIAAGKRAAAAALASHGRDPSRPLVPYRPRTTPGEWVPTGLPVIRDQVPLMALWSIPAVDPFMPPPPPSLTSETWARDLEEVKLVGGKSSTARTTVQSQIARYRITPVMMPTLRAIADMPGRTTVQNARMLALFQMAGDDTDIVTSAAKLKYNFWRPITAIRNAEDDGNPATTPDAAWESFIGTPNHPEYPCAHCSFASAVATILKAEVGAAPPGGVQVGSRSLKDVVVQRLPTFDQWVADVSNSRIYGGVHFRFSNEAAEALGARVAAETLKLMRPLDQ